VLSVRPDIDEHGFSLVELLVVMVIFAVIAAIALASMVGARNQASEGTVRASGVAIDAAVRAFRRDHGSRSPVLGNAGDWPEATKGPVDRQGQHYMRRRDEALAGGAVGVVDSTTGGGTAGRLRYERPTASTYRITVEGRAGGTWKSVCWFGTTAPGSTVPRC
jgi:prepilin-type N-terminal cleavage/methylation domain-containing protein